MRYEVLTKEIDLFVERKSRNWAPATKRNNLYAFAWLKKFLDGKDFDRDNVEHFFDYLRTQKISPNTQKQIETDTLALAKDFFFEGKEPINWTGRIERIKVKKVPRLTPSLEEMIGLIKKVTEPGKYDNHLTRFSKNEHRWCLLFILLCSGTRNFETREIKRCDVSISSREIIIEKGKTGPRKIHIPPIPWLIAELERRVKGRNEEELKALRDKAHYNGDYSDRLFVANATRLQDIMREAGKLWGRPLNVHDLRRACLRDYRTNGADIVKIADVAGHKNVETTRGYLLFDTSDQEKTMREFNSEARKYRTSQEKATEFVTEAYKIGNVLEQQFNTKSGVLTMKLKIN